MSELPNGDLLRKLFCAKRSNTAIDVKVSLRIEANREQIHLIEQVVFGKPA
jgi:hypothetical protein